MSKDNKEEVKNIVSQTGKTTELNRPVIFAQGSVKQLRESDFTINSKELICLNFNDCTICLFYGDNKESTNLIKVWASSSSQIAGITFAALHLGMETKVSASFNKLNTDINHPFYWARLQQMPFIITYRQGWPVAFYNGERSSQSLVDYSLTLACRAEYREEEQKFFSTTIDDNVETGNAKEIITEKRGNITLPPRTSSTDYKTNTPLRGYDPTSSVKKVGGNTVQPDKVANPAGSNTRAAPISQPRP